jgi:hypothetical protein
MSSMAFESNGRQEIESTYHFNPDRPGIHGPVQVYGWRDQMIGDTILNGFTINFEGHYKDFPLCSAKSVGSSEVHVTLPAIPYTSCKEFPVLNAMLQVWNRYHNGLANAEIHHLNDMNS